MVVGDVDRASRPRGAAPARGDVAADADEHAAAAALPRAAAAARSAAHALAVAPRSSLTPAGMRTRGARAVERRPSRQPRDARAQRVSRRGALAASSAVGAAASSSPVAVVAGQLERPPDRRVDVAVGQLGRAQRQLERLEQQRADARRAARARAFSARQLGVRAEAAAGAVDRVELALDGRAARCERARARSRAARRSSRAPASVRVGRAGAAGSVRVIIRSLPRRPAADSCRRAPASWAGAVLGAGAGSSARRRFLRRSRFLGGADSLAGGFLAAADSCGRGFLGAAALPPAVLGAARRGAGGGFEELSASLAVAGALAPARGVLAALRLRGLAGEGAGGDLGEDAGEHDAAGDQPAVDAAEPAQARRRGCGWCGCGIGVAPASGREKRRCACSQGRTRGSAGSRARRPSDERAARARASRPARPVHDRRCSRAAAAVVGAQRARQRRAGGASTCSAGDRDPDDEADLVERAAASRARTGPRTAARRRWRTRPRW